MELLTGTEQMYSIKRRTVTLCLKELDTGHLFEKIMSDSDYWIIIELLLDYMILDFVRTPVLRYERFGIVGI